MKERSLYVGAVQGFSEILYILLGVQCPFYKTWAKKLSIRSTSKTQAQQPLKKHKHDTSFPLHWQVVRKKHTTLGRKDPTTFGQPINFKVRSILLTN